MTYVAGWWTLDAEGPALVNRLTGERVVLRGPVSAEDAVAPGAWLRFDYEHAELRYPLLVEADPPVRGNNPNTLDLRLDHVRSARLWREQTEASQAHPSYGTWRRVDDCVTDALACWPETDTTIKPLRRGFRVRGGWLNDAWDEGMDRDYQILGTLPFSLLADFEGRPRGILFLERSMQYDGILSLSCLGYWGRYPFR